VPRKLRDEARGVKPDRAGRVRARTVHHYRIADDRTVTDWLGRHEVWRARSFVMGTLGGFPNPPATLRCRQSRQAPHAFA